MKIRKSRSITGLHNDADRHAVALPVPKEIVNRGEVRMSWIRTTFSESGNTVHSMYFHDEAGKFLCTYTFGEQEVLRWTVVENASKLIKKGIESMTQLLQQLQQK